MPWVYSPYTGRLVAQAYVRSQEKSDQQRSVPLSGLQPGLVPSHLLKQEELIARAN